MLFPVSCAQSLSYIQLFATPWTAHSLAGSSVHGISQAGVLEWVAISFSRRSSWPQASNPCSMGFPSLPALQADFFPLSHLGSPPVSWVPRKESPLESIHLLDTGWSRSSGLENYPDIPNCIQTFSPNLKTQPDFNILIYSPSEGNVKICLICIVIAYVKSSNQATTKLHIINVW